MHQMQSEILYLVILYPLQALFVFLMLAVTFWLSTLLFAAAFNLSKSMFWQFFIVIPLGYVCLIYFLAFSLSIRIFNVLAFIFLFIHCQDYPKEYHSIFMFGALMASFLYYTIGPPGILGFVAYQNMSMFGIFFQEFIDYLGRPAARHRLFDEGGLQVQTHTASIHHSASASAEKLWNRYGNQLEDISLTQKLEELRLEVASQTENQHRQHADNCIDRLSGEDMSHKDAKSHVTLKQLLGLSWVAINDENQREGEKSDALDMLIEGLYEIQRGYNFDEQGVGNDNNDRPICSAGAFNKIIGKLTGIHPDVEMQYITPAGASYKLLALVKENSQRYKTQHPNDPKNSDQLWQAIKPMVAKELYQEYGSLYPQGMQDQDFQELIDAGKDAIDIPANKTLVPCTSRILWLSL